MSGLQDTTGIVAADGRVARRERNINTVLDVILEMFAEESLFPTIEQAATRSGLSLRSIYRYFADPGELLEAAIVRSREKVAELARLPGIGRGPLPKRIDDFVAMRLRVYEEVGPMYRATVVNAASKPQIQEELTRVRNEFREQFVLQFAAELKGRKPADRAAALAAGDLLTQLDSIDFLQCHLRLSIADTATAIRSALRPLLR
jgi:AcrR family transcriptional regulator